MIVHSVRKVLPYLVWVTMLCCPTFLCVLLTSGQSFIPASMGSPQRRKGSVREQYKLVGSVTGLSDRHGTIGEPMACPLSNGALCQPVVDLTSSNNLQLVT